MKNYTLAAQLFTVRELLKDRPAKEVYEVLKQIKDMGYPAVQISGIGPITKELADLYETTCNELNLEICATHVSLDELDQNLEWIIDYHKQWKCKYIGIGSMPDIYRNSEGIKAFAARCNTIGEALHKHGLVLIYHNHKFEFEKHEGKTWMDMLYVLFDPRYVEFEIDTYWVQAGGSNPVEWINKVNNRMSVVHFKDFRIVKDEQQFAEIGAGNLDWTSIIKACDQTCVKYAAVEQDRFTEDPVASLKLSIEYLLAK